MLVNIDVIMITIMIMIMIMIMTIAVQSFHFHYFNNNIKYSNYNNGKSFIFLPYLPPNNSHTGRPATFPKMSQHATSM